MPQTVSNETILKSYDAYVSNGENQTAAAKSIGIARTTLQDHLKMAARRGLDGSVPYPAPQGFIVKQNTVAYDKKGDKTSQSVKFAEESGGVFEVATGHAVKGVSSLVDADGRIKQQWVKTDTKAQETDDFLDRMAKAFENIPAAKPVPTPKDNLDDLLAFYPHADVHLGMRVTADQSGKRPYNRKIASERFREGVSKCMARSPDAGTALIVNMGDLLHANDDTDSTPRSKHKLKVDGSHHENFELAIELTAYKIDLALQKHDKVVYRGIPGNHDPNIPGPLSMALKQRYRNEPRCVIEVSEDAIWKFNWGKVFLAGAHGDGRKAKDTCAELPGRFPKEWGKATQWHYFSGHFHEYKSEHHGPVRHHQLPSVCSADTHSAWAPYSDNSAIMALVFSKDGLTRDTVCVGV